MLEFLEQQEKQQEEDLRQQGKQQEDLKQQEKQWQDDFKRLRESIER